MKFTPQGVKFIHSIFFLRVDHIILLKIKANKYLKIRRQIRGHFTKIQNYESHRLISL